MESDDGSRVILRAVDVVKKFDELLALNKLSIDVFEGEILGLVGPNGAGKTTFINVVCGLLRPDGGHIYFRGQNIVGRKVFELARKGIIKTFQIPKVFGNISVLENLVSSASWMGFSVEELRRQAYESLRLVNLEEKQGLLASQLSGGERKLLEFARAMMLKPKLLLLDEPFAGVNPVLKNRLIQALKKVNSEGLSILIVSHDMSEIRKLCGRIVFMTAGSKLVEGPPEDVLRNQEVVNLYLGVKRNAAG
ncbi:MAG: ATP-binding cassette domain-containing protein [Candidatus Caldarchaeum sp.]|nr:ATP-binding cassette domain-containing protein [Candidatus Caldarchaeum sp.]MCX8200898.1 ATP-binding cassette domain-containing protein [Candidatus Caldarchaeum sp.]MDW8063830.1 ATP-binding cassette domain-containing protein [Candidatus Caldarchaeum sp.]MDW8435669.1 ATP-binding cassette domain-containing protein [Candidatus Caldarchaeum sp.]